MYQSSWSSLVDGSSRHLIGPLNCIFEIGSLKMHCKKNVWLIYEQRRQEKRSTSPIKQRTVPGCLYSDVLRCTRRLHEYRTAIATFKGTIRVKIPIPSCYMIILNFYTEELINPRRFKPNLMIYEMKQYQSASCSDHKPHSPFLWP